MINVVGHFEIPEEMAKELSDLLIKQTVREKLLLQLLNEPEQYDLAEAKLLPITARVEAMKIKITKEYVQAEYASSRYVWNYLGWETAKNKVEVIDNG